MNELDERIRAALRAAVDGLQEHDLRPAQPPIDVPDRRILIRWSAPLLAAAAVIAIVATTLALTVSSPSADHRQQPGVNSPTSLSPTLTTSPTVGTSRTRSASTSNPPPSGHTSHSKPTSHSSSHHAPNYGPLNCYLDVPCPGGTPSRSYVALWPFSSYTQAHQWQTVDRKAGHEPWHLDAGQTALSFVQGYLGFTDITEVTSTDISTDSNDAQIGVGYDNPAGSPHTAATLHLVRYSITNGYPIAPWEVVGGTTTDLTIDTPGNASGVTSPLTVSGQITGTDENITVSLRSLDGGVYTGTPVPAGGDAQPWSAEVSFQATGVMTLVASTGGHVTEHERFVVTGVNAS